MTPLDLYSRLFRLTVTIVMATIIGTTFFVEASAKMCSFESDFPCPYWHFTNSNELHLYTVSQNTTSAAAPTNNRNGFYVVLSGGGNVSNHYATHQVMGRRVGAESVSGVDQSVAMLVTPFFERTNPQCELNFRLRILGEHGAELLVTTEQLSLRLFHPDSPQEEDEDWTRPTLRARFEPNPSASGGEPWTRARVPIGTFPFPSRIRVECHPAATSVGEGILNAECSVDDLELSNCGEELWRGADGTEDTCAGEDRLACRQVGGSRQLCLGPEHICDMHPDCAEGEDELETGHRCAQVPEGTRCDFEDLRSQAGCAQWRFFSSQAGGNYTSSTSSRQHLVSLAAAHDHRAGIPSAEYLSEGRLFRPGHFLFFSSYDHTQSGEHDIVYSYALSPPLPAIPPSAQCWLRFFYCQTGSSPFQVFMARRDHRELAKPLWAPPHDEHVQEPCIWRRTGVRIASEMAQYDYSLKLSFAKLAGSLGSIAIDDLSLSTGCFAANNRPLSARLSLSAGEDSAGDEGPSKWIVQRSGEYRLELAGASGGTFFGSGDGASWGDVLVANVRLEAGREVAVLLGERGKCICDEGAGRHSGAMREWLCTERTPTKALEADPRELPGCGGGGATLFLYAGRPMAVAGGGGGDFLVRAVPEQSHLQKTSRQGTSGRSLEWAEGQRSFNWSEWRRGAECPDGTAKGFGGGLGGGGASCGAGGGGGGGMKGGAPGALSPGSGGSSSFLFPVAPHLRITVPGANAGVGRLLLLACPQHLCPSLSNCSFAPPQPNVGAVPLCICPGGRQVPPNGSCSEEPSLLNRLFASQQQHLPPLLLLLCLVLVVLSALLCLLCCVQLFRSLRRPKLSDVHELMAIAAEAGGPAAAEGGAGTKHCAGNRISGNPIYEPLLLSPLPQIPRHSLRLEKIIGHGAFGEVFEGYLMEGNGTTAVKVAVKTLPVDSARDFGDDFETEARLLSQFKHENIVTFFGVSFEQQPKYIVLEFLEGGDLKNFLRENRPRPVGPSSPETEFSRQCQDQEATSLRMGDLFAAALDVARGCEHLEATRFVHRDIAARNCLLTAKIGRRVVKIADFGMARDIYRNDYYRKGGKAFLPVRWMPPESFLDGLFTSKTDVWAFGVLLWELFSLGYIPYSGRENHEVMRLIVAGDRLDPPIGVPNEVYDIMLACWNTDSEKRPSFAELVRVFEALLRRDDLPGEPLPPVRHRLANERSVSATPSMSRAGDPHPTSTTSQATVSTVLSSAPEGGSITTSTYESMPTAGDGVCRAVFPPYQPSMPNNGLICMDGRRRQRGSLSSSSDSHDSTLHESAGTVKLQHQHCIRRPPPLSLRPSPAKSVVPAVQPHSHSPPSSDQRRPPCSSSSPFPPRNQSLPPLPSADCTADKDSGIASARSIASADAAVLLMLDGRGNAASGSSNVQC